MCYYGRFSWVAGRVEAADVNLSMCVCVCRSITDAALGGKSSVNLWTVEESRCFMCHCNPSRKDPTCVKIELDIYFIAERILLVNNSEANIENKGK